MKLTRQSNYAIRTLIYCAVNDPQLSRIGDIAKAHGISELFLFKILQPLNKAGLVETVRGRNGGVRLGRPAEKITLFDVVKVTEDSFAMAECFEDDGDVDCPLIDSCGLNSALRKALIAAARARGTRRPCSTSNSQACTRGSSPSCALARCSVRSA